MGSAAQWPEAPLEGLQCGSTDAKERLNFLLLSIQSRCLMESAAQWPEAQLEF